MTLHNPVRVRQLPDLNPKEMDMAQAKFDMKTLDPRNLELPDVDLKDATKPFYASLGLTDLAVEAVRDYVTDMQQKLADVQKSVSGLELQPEQLRDQALARYEDLSKDAKARYDGLSKDAKARYDGLSKDAKARFDALSKDAKARRVAVEARMAELQADANALPAKVQDVVNENLSQVNDTYGDLVKRGELLLGRIRTQDSTQEAVKAAETTVAKAKTTKTQATKAAKTTAKKAKTSAKSTKKVAAEKSSAPRSSAKATATAAKKTAARTVEAAKDAVDKVGD